MTKRIGRDRRLVPIPEELVQSLLKGASREGKPLNQFVEDALRLVLNSLSMGYSYQELARVLETVQTQKASGMTLVPVQVLKYLESKVYPVEPEALQTEWFKAGLWYGKYLKEKFSKPAEVLAELLEVTRWELDEVDVKEESSAVKFRCVSAILSLEETLFLKKFVEGSMQGLGYKLIKEDSVKGIIFLEFKAEAE